MRNHVFPVLVVIAVTAAFGCGPKLAETPYGEKETAWKDFIQRDYPCWEPPASIPPTKFEQDAAAIDIITVEPVTPLDITVVEIDSVETAPAVVEPLVVESPAAPRETYHTVSKGETMWSIAKQYYGDGKKWRLLQDANPAVDGAKGLKAGMELRVPAAE